MDIDPNPWFCTLCGRMSSPNHIGRLHYLPLWDTLTEVVYRPRSAEEVEANKEEREPRVLAALKRLT